MTRSTLISRDWNVSKKAPPANGHDASMGYLSVKTTKSVVHQSTHCVSDH